MKKIELNKYEKSIVKLTISLLTQKVYKDTKKFYDTNDIFNEILNEIET